MKNRIVKPTLFLALLAGVFAGCVEDNDFDIPTINSAFFSEDFNQGGNVDDGQPLTIEGWINHPEVGTELWTEEVFDEDGTAQFNPYGNGEAVNISWLISPQIKIGQYQNVKMSFRSAMNFVSNDEGNRVELYASSDFDGTNFSTATWKKFDAKYANSDNDSYEMVPSGEVDLSSFVGQDHISIGFKAIGSGANTSLDGLFQINDLNVYTTN